jgi:hypothetical protein
MKVALPATLFAMFGLGCLCCGSDMKQTFAKYVPAVRKVSPEFDYHDVSCDTDVYTPKALGCTTGSLSCGAVVEANNKHGNKLWDDDFYQQARCTPERNDYEDSPEVVWALEVPPNTQADIRLDSNCADLDVIAAYWVDTEHCPTSSHAHRINECEMETKRGSGKLRLTTVDKAQVYLVGVDGKHGETGNFRLTVECATYR